MRSKIHVNLECNHTQIPEKEVEFIDIEEDIMGRDVLTFKCPVCHEEHQSYRVGG